MRWRLEHIAGTTDGHTRLVALGTEARADAEVWLGMTVGFDAIDVRIPASAAKAYGRALVEAADQALHMERKSKRPVIRQNGQESRGAAREGDPDGRD